MIPKFKAYDLTENEWINVGRIVLCEKGELWYLQGLDENFKDIDPPYFKEDLGKAWVLLQSTGLFDKNGTEIYEGDIIDKGYSNMSIVNRVGYVQLSKGGDSDGWAHGEWIGWITDNEDSLLDVHEHCTVLGNKFTQPHLIEEE